MAHSQFHKYFKENAIFIPQHNMSTQKKRDVHGDLNPNTELDTKHTKPGAEPDAERTKSDTTDPKESQANAKKPTENIEEKRSSTGEKVEALRKLWHAAPVASFFTNMPQAAPHFNEDLARKKIDGFIEYFCGRMIRADFSAFVEGDASIFADYDRDFGEGKAKSVLGWD